MSTHQKRLAQTPPMGWNSWDCYGASVREEEVLANAQYMATHLKEYGWEYVVVDIQWYEPGAHSSQYRPFVPLEMDEYSRLIPAVNRFPSAKDGKGFKPLADEVHSLGLKFGIHIMRGIPRQAVHQNTPILGTDGRARDIAMPNSICPWNTDMYGVNPNAKGAQEYYNSLFNLYAQWGVDFVKVDDIAASRLYGMHKEEIKMIRKAIEQCGRDMVLSLSPGPAPLEEAEFLGENANMWRMTDDFWDIWDTLYQMFERCEKWYPYVKPGNWPDCDMLPIGHIGIRSVDGGAGDRFTRFTKDEQMTMLSLWGIFRSPLMVGCELNDNDEFTYSLLTNRDLLDMHRYSYANRPVSRKDDLVVWTAKGPAGETYVAQFNLTEEEQSMTTRLSELSLNEAAPYECFDIWTKEMQEITAAITSIVPKHGVKLYRLREK
ncbi:MAG TPA: glycoside hydrolase family 27 protein [Tissierellia bacterium]|nr:glycoside hydrolase family 27 protein [Tissierellia bacterium]